MASPSARKAVAAHSRRFYWQLASSCLASSFLLALARPPMGSGAETVYQRGRDLMIAPTSPVPCWRPTCIQPPAKGQADVID